MVEFGPLVKHADKTFRVIDTHTMGEPTRIILQGFPELQGDTMMERMHFLAKNYDHYRTALMLEPRGHKDMFGALITEPTREEADLGVIFMANSGYLNMCGHGTIGVATAAVEAGLVDVSEPYTQVTLDAPAGLIQAKVKVENGRAVEVRFINVPSFVYAKGLAIEVPEYGKIPFDIAFGGSFFAIVDAERIGIPIRRNRLPALTDLGMKLLKGVNRFHTVKHPYLDITKVDLAEFYGKADNPEADLKNAVVFGDSQVDRSPCGTGTSAKLACLYDEGKIGVGEAFVYESITGSLFRGMITKETEVGGKRAVIPQITGSAYITGLHQFVICNNDPQRHGFLL